MRLVAGPPSLAACLWSALALSAPAQISVSEEAAPTRIDSAAALLPEPLDTPVEAALGWAKFIAAGYRNAADHLGNGAAADAELAIGGALEALVKTTVEALPGKKGKVRLNDAVEGAITRLEEGGLIVTVNKSETLVAWADIDPIKLAVLLLKNKPTAEGDLAAIATLRLLGGDAGDAKTKSGKLAGDFGGKLKELLEDFKAVGPELKAVRSLDIALRERDAGKAIERFKAVWAEVSATKFGAEVADGAREQFVLRGEEALAGTKALEAAFEGKVTINPSRVSPDAGPGGAGIVLEYEFDRDAEVADFDTALCPKRVLGMVRGGGAATPAPFLIDRGRLVGSTLQAGGFPITFAGDIEVEVQGGVSETAPGGSVGFFLIGFASPEADEMLFMDNFQSAQMVLAGKNLPAEVKKIDPLGRGTQVLCTMRYGAGKVTFALNSDATPPADFKPSAPLRPFFLAGGPCYWFLERITIRGSATGESLGQLAHVVAERDAKALFGK